MLIHEYKDIATEATEHLYRSHGVALLERYTTSPRPDPPINQDGETITSTHSAVKKPISIQQQYRNNRDV